MQRSEINRRKTTVYLSRKVKASTEAIKELEWYVLGDLPPHYPVPAIREVVNPLYRYAVSEYNRLSDDIEDLKQDIQWAREDMRPYYRVIREYL